MTGLAARASDRLRRVLGIEMYLFLAYALLTIRPGAAPPRLPGQTAIEPKPVSADWSPEEYKLFIEEARIDVGAQQADKRDIRARAQIILTT